ncbi:MAG: type II methionyl aminopeptidase [archaeon]
MEDEIIQKYKKAGVILKKAQELARGLCKPGASVLELTEKVEGLIKKEGAGIGFPLNISINENAAHFTPDTACKLLIGEDDLVKIDIGVHVDGYIADSAITLSMSQSEEHKNLIQAAEAGLKAGLELAKPGTTLGELGTAIEKAIKEFNVVPIANLTGHTLEQNTVHAGLSVPNIKNDSRIKLEEGMAVAIEPFSTNGVGMVTDANEVYIYEYLQDKPTRNREARKILQMSKEELRGLPFAARWVEEELGLLKAKMAIRELSKNKALYQYPVLREKSGGLVAQAEHTVLILEKPIITTK